MRTRLGMVLYTAALIAWPIPCAGQVVRASASPLMPHSWDGAVTKSSRDRQPVAEVARFISLYATPYLGVPGAMLDTAGVVDTTRAVHFPSVHFTISAAARIQPGGGETRANRALKRLNAHVRIEALDKDSLPITDPSALAVLEVQPNTQKYEIAAQDSASVRGAMSIASRSLVEEALTAASQRVRPILASFKNLFHHPDSPTQVSYVSDHNEFGWTWYEHSDKTLEGVHNAAVLLETHPNVRFLFIKIDVITDWGHHGGWQRSFESVIDLGGR